MVDEHRSHPSVARVIEALGRAGTSPDVRWFDDATPTAQQAANALGVPIGAIANSLVFTIDGEPLLVMASGAHRVDTAWLSDVLGGRVKRADAGHPNTVFPLSYDELVRVTGGTPLAVAPDED